MEVPQWVAIQERYYLLFSVPGEHHSAARQRRTKNPSTTGTHYLVAEQPLGPFHALTDQFLQGDVAGTLYSGKLIQDRNGQWQYLAFRNMTAGGEFVGELIDPMPVEVHKDGRLTLTRISE